MYIVYIFKQKIHYSTRKLLSSLLQNPMNLDIYKATYKNIVFFIGETDGSDAIHSDSYDCNNNVNKTDPVRKIRPVKTMKLISICIPLH